MGGAQIGRDVRIDGPSVLRNATIGDGCRVQSFTVIEDAVMEAESSAGPYARIRIGSRLAPQSYVGNFVEMKQAHLSRNSLACHLSYLGERRTALVLHCVSWILPFSSCSTGMGANARLLLVKDRQLLGSLE